MDSSQISQKITRVTLILVFFFVSGFSLYLANELVWPVIIFAFIKGLLAMLFSWLFFLIINDAIVKSVMVSVANMQEMRKFGGLLYHFIKPADDEIILRETKKADKKAKRKKK